MGAQNNQQLHSYMHLSMLRHCLFKMKLFIDIWGKVAQILYLGNFAKFTGKHLRNNFLLMDLTHY